MGWKTFATEPPDGELIAVYIEDNDGKYWLANAKYSHAHKAVIWCETALFETMCVVLWRERYPLPRLKMVKEAPAVRCIEDPDDESFISGWIDPSVRHIHESAGQV